MISSIIEKFKYLRLKPFDINDEKGREDERLRKIMLSSSFSLLTQIIKYAIMLCMVPMLLNHLGREQYGFWLSISAATAFSAFSDLGLGNGIINFLGKSYGQNDKKSARIYLSSAILIISFVAFLLGSLGFFILAKIDWVEFFNLKNPILHDQATSAVLIFWGFFVVNLPFNLVKKAQLAYQDDYLNSIWLSISNVLMLIAVFFGVKQNQDILYFVSVLAGIPVIICILNNIYLYGFRWPWICPSIKYFSIPHAKQLLKKSFLFFTFGLAGFMSIQIDTLVIGRYLGADAVPAYTIPLSLFMVITTFIGFFMKPLWPAYREAFVRSEGRWIKKMLRKTLALSLCLSISLSALLMILMPHILDIWIGESFYVSKIMIIALAVNCIVNSVSAPISMLLNSSDIIGVRAFFAIIAAILNLWISIFLVKTIGVSGPIWGTIIAQITIGWTISFYYLKTALNLSNEKKK